LRIFFVFLIYAVVSVCFVAKEINHMELC